MARPITYDRDEVLENAKNVFWKNGFLDTSISDLEEATGLVRTSLYAAFGNKKALYKACLKKYKNDNLQWLTQRLSENANPIIGLKQIFNEVIELAYMDKDGRGCLMANANQERQHLCSDTLNLLQDNKEQVLSIFSSQIKEAKKMNILKNDIHTKTTALALFMLQLGVMGSVIQTVPKKELQKSTELMLNKLLDLN